MGALRDLLRIPTFALLFLAGVSSGAGDELRRVAIPIMVLASTGSGALTGASVGVQFLPIAILGPFAGVLADRWNRKGILVFSEMARAVLVALVVVAPVPTAMPLLFLVGAFGAIYHPARSAALPDIVGRDRLSAAIAVTAVTSQLLQLTMPAIAGLVVATAGAATTVALTAAASVVSCALLALMRFPAVTRAKVGGPWDDFVVGVRFALSSRTVRNLTSLWLLLNCALASLTVALVTYVTRDLGMSPATYGITLAALSLGVLGGVSFGGAVRSHDQLTLATSPLGAALVLAAFWARPSFEGVLALTAMAGAFVGAYNTLGSAWLGQTVPTEIRGRVYSLVNGMITLVFVGTSVIVGIATDLVPSASALGGAGVGLTALYVLLRKRWHWDQSALRIR